MAKVCQVTGTRTRTGHHVSHSNVKTNRKFRPNVRRKAFFVPSENRYVTLNVSSKGMRIIDKVGIETVLAELAARGEKI